MKTLLLLAVTAFVPSTTTGDPSGGTEVEGPMIGGVGEDTVSMWIRSPEGEPIELEILDAGGEVVESRSVEAPEDADGSSIVRIDGLAPGTRHTYRIDGATNTDWWFATRPADDRTARIAFASCADEGEGSGRVWKRMDADAIDALVLLGDTPYIDTTKLAQQRRRYREFAAFPPFAELVSHVSVCSVWDDHDFGRNDVDGRLPGKENSRKAFTEHRPNPSFGSGDEGIFTSFRIGPVEVFVLDTRWFARTAGLPDDPTLLGAAQWAWLERGLAKSTAPFRILTCGMIFNDATRPGKTDHWGMYPKEFDRLLGVLERTGSDGVLLVSGDIHWSRVIEHDTKARLGRDLREIVTSPVHHRLIKAADAPHPGIVFSKGIVNSFLLVEAGTNEDGDSTLVARLRDADGTTHHEERMKVAGDG